MSKILEPVTRITNGVMTGTAVLTSLPVDGRHLQQLKWLASWTGTPTGTFSLQESMNYNPNTGVGDWFDNGSDISDAAGAAGSVIVNLSNRAPSWYQLVYTNQSGTGVLNVYASGAGV